jgi:two-component system OmpR family sensor kinase
MTESEHRTRRGRRPRQGAPRSTRLRLLGWMLLLVGLTLAATSGGIAVVLNTELQERIDLRLANKVTAFRTLAGSHPLVAGRPVTQVRDLLALGVFMDSDSGEQTSLGLVDGVPVERPSGDLATSMTSDPALLARFAAATAPKYGDAVTRAGCVRYVVVPVQAQSDPARGEFIVAISPDRERAEITGAVSTDAAIGLGGLLLAAGVGWLVAGHLLAPLRLLRDAARTISESDLTRRIPVHGRDELSDLAATFNSMLDRLQGAFRTQRQFLDDAGHELRTPITIIRGRLELLGDDPRQRLETIEVVTDELDRMSRMVEDLFTLTKTRRPDFLHPEPVDLAEFVEEIYIKAAALADRRWLLEEPSEPSSVLLHGDRHRLTQALIQLAQNAAQHTPEAEPIHIGYAIRGTTAFIWVRDSGPGIPPADQDHIFERFARAAPTRCSTGAGLGLAIVKAIAEAHSGRITVDSRPGVGATFTLELPITARTKPSAIEEQTVR